MDISGNGGITDHGIIVLAQAIETRGLPMLDTFGIERVDTQKVTSVGIRALTRTATGGCPKLGEILINDEYGDIAKDMLRAAEGNTRCTRASCM